MWKLYSLVSLHNATCFVLSNIKSSFRILSNGHIKTKIDLTKKLKNPCSEMIWYTCASINNLHIDWEFAAKDIHHFRNS